MSLLYMINISRAFQSNRNKFLKVKITSKATATNDASNEASVMTILGFGSLLSERSSRTTFPELRNFRLGRIPNYRRVFGHPASIFFQRGIASLETKRMSSLSAEYSPESSFVCSVFEVPNNEMMENGIPSEAFLEREEEFDIVTVPYLELDTQKQATGILCTASTDDDYIRKWGTKRFQDQYRQYGVSTIWGWSRDSGLLPCDLYLRHCVLASESMGEECYNSFLDDTYLVDRTTTLRSYLENNPEIMLMEPPPELAIRYGG